MNLKLGDTVQIKKEWWPQTDLGFRDKFKSITRNGEIIDVYYSVYDVNYRIKWDEIGEFGGHWTDKSVELCRKKNHPHTTTFR